MPELGGVRKVAFSCCDDGDMPFDSLSFVSGRLRGRRGFTLWHRVYLRRAISGCCPLDPYDFLAVELILHELCHVASFRAHPLLYPLRYLADLMRYGYLRHPDEIETRGRATALRVRYQNDHPFPTAVGNGAGTTDPRALSAAEIAACCGALHNGEPTFALETAREASPPSGTSLTATVTARQACGIRALIVRPSLLIDGYEAPLPVEHSPGGGCLSARALTLVRIVQPGARLRLVAEAVSGCGRVAVGTFVVDE
jgi:hypothetical protein